MKTMKGEVTLLALSVLAVVAMLGGTITTVVESDERPQQPPISE